MIIKKDLMKKVVKEVTNSDKFKELEAKEAKYHKIGYGITTTAAVAAIGTLGASIKYMTDTEAGYQFVSKTVQEHPALAPAVVAGVAGFTGYSYYCQAKEARYYHQKQDLIAKQYIREYKVEQLVESGQTVEQANETIDNWFADKKKMEELDKEFVQATNIESAINDRPFHYVHYLEENIENDVVDNNMQSEIEAEYGPEMND